MKHYFLFIVIGLIFSNVVVAQNLDTIKVRYDNWLQYRNLDKVLKVQTIRKQKDTLKLYLAFRFANRDSVLASWRSCNAITPNLNELLFKAFVAISYTSPQLLYIQLYDTYDLTIEPCFKYGIRWQANTRNVVTDSAFCRAKAEPIVIQINADKPKRYIKKRKNVVDIRATKEEIYTRILAKSESYFKNRTNKFQKYPINDKTLVFKVGGLKQEVLSHKDNPKICDIIKWFHEIDCRTNEYLIFTFNCDIANNEITLTCNIEGLFGSFTNENPKEYSNMETDFSYFLQMYTDNFMSTLIYPLLK